MRHSIQIALAIVAASIIGDAGLLKAASVTTNLPVSATITPGCSVAASGINFGELTSGVAKQSSGSVTVNCQSNVSYRVAMSAGSNLQGLPSIRTMKHSALNEFVGYQLFKDSSLTSEWGDSGAGNTYTNGTTVSGTGTGSAQQLTVYGLQNGFISTTATGTFSDTVLVSVLF